MDDKRHSIDKLKSLIESILGVSIRYERFSELYLKLFAGAIACAILYAVLKRFPSAVSASRQNYVSFRLTRANCKLIFYKIISVPNGQSQSDHYNSIKWWQGRLFQRCRWNARSQARSYGIR